MMSQQCQKHYTDFLKDAASACVHSDIQIGERNNIVGKQMTQAAEKKRDGN